MLDTAWSQSTYVALGYGFAALAFTVTGIRLWWSSRYLENKLRDLQK